MNDQTNNVPWVGRESGDSTPRYRTLPLHSVQETSPEPGPRQGVPILSLHFHSTASRKPATNPCLGRENLYYPFTSTPQRLGNQPRTRAQIGSTYIILAKPLHSVQDPGPKNRGPDREYLHYTRSRGVNHLSRIVTPWHSDSTVYRKQALDNTGLDGEYLYFTRSKGVMYLSCIVTPSHLDRHGVPTLPDIVKLSINYIVTHKYSYYTVYSVFKN